MTAHYVLGPEHVKQAVSFEPQHSLEGWVPLSFHMTDKKLRSHRQQQNMTGLCWTHIGSE